jgi:hypothetical protein
MLGPNISISNGTTYCLSIVTLYANPSLGLENFLKTFNKDFDTIDPGSGRNVVFDSIEKLSSHIWLRFEKLPPGIEVQGSISNLIPFCDVLVIRYFSKANLYSPQYIAAIRPNSMCLIPFRGNDYLVLIPVTCGQQSDSDSTSQDSHQNPHHSGGHAHHDYSQSNIPK